MRANEQQKKKLGPLGRGRMSQEKTRRQNSRTTDEKSWVESIDQMINDVDIAKVMKTIING